MSWLNNWYIGNCNGDWEHDYGISIETIDNPGWSVTIDTVDTSRELKDVQWTMFEVSPDDWYGYKVENGKFEASGDPKKIEILIAIFKEIVDKV